ncbi:glycerate kinase [Georgenia yuyongxinii]|uniref:Glycerate kinase n=1 Tax=Georgenia yuyongxinii TaxID=2589797 RepID=A0A552WW24_9MICO|nr:glycerate kinase [Georgenia yuyongxinii]TRW47018.1 glycerate kinase [Georgenia yuyongxinii]
MKLVLAPDSFKESMTAQEAVEAMSRGVRAVFPDAELVAAPMADGGEGTTAALTAALGGELVTAAAHDALGRPITATYGYVADERLAVVEVAAAAGIDLVAPAERDPLRTSTAGVGQMLLDALDRGARRLVVGLGGSVTNDGGAGMLQALGVRLLDADGAELPPGGGALARLADIDATGLDPRLAALDVEIASDVTNPLCGPEGASAVFGPQKGATPKMVAELDRALGVFAEAVSSATGRDVADRAGAGAAGGLGAAFLAFFDARLRPGVDVVMTAARLEERMAGADLVLTGEGGVDAQTLLGKTPFGVARAASRHGVPVIAFAGHVGDGAELLYDNFFAAIVPIVRSVTDLPTALAQGQVNLERAVETVCRVLALRSTEAFGAGEASRPLSD